MNVHDTEKMSGGLLRMGYSPASSPETANVIILNTCSVREKAQEKVFSKLGSYAALKQNDSVFIGVAGCVAQQEGQYVIDRAPFVDFVLGTQSISYLPEVLARVIGKQEKVIEIGRHPESLDIPPEQIERVSGVKAYITIMEGCDNFCTFCIVPFTRGRERCRSIKSVVKEVQVLAEAGYKEVQLLGQNVNSYREEGTGATFEDLLDAAHLVEGISRIRFTSPHPKDFGDPLIARYRDLPKLCPHMHLPAQSGSTDILARMNRGYSREEFISKVALARASVPDIAFTTDLIVGFPGESQRDFDDTLSLIQEIGFDGIYSFKYSERPYTFAEREQCDDVPEEIKTERLARLQEYQKRIQLRKNQNLVGEKQDVLVEGRSRKSPDEFSGRSPHNRVVNFAGSAPVGTIIPVEITRAGPNSLFGESIH